MRIHKIRIPIFFLIIFIVALGILIYWLTSSASITLPQITVQPIPIIPSIVKDFSPPNSIPATSVIVEGILIDETQMPYTNASIHLTCKDASFTQKPDPYGRFSFSVTPGNYILSATAEDSIIPSTKTLIVENQKNHFIEILLPRIKSITGSVTDESGKTIADALIRISGLRINNQPTVIPVQYEKSGIHYKSNSDNDGHFDFYGIWPGSYEMIVEADGYIPHIENPLCADNKPKNIVLRKMASLEVNVLDQNNSPVNLAAVNLKLLNSPKIQIMNRETSNAGKAIFNDLHIGNYRIDASHKDYDQINQSHQTIAITSDKAVSNLYLKHKGYTVSGQVIDFISKAGVAGVTIGLSLLNDEYGENMLFTTMSSNQGNFFFNSVYPEAYIFHIVNEKIHPDYAILNNENHKNSVTVMDHDVDHLQVFVAAPASIQGTIYSADKIPVAGAEVTVLFAGFTKSAGDGTYLFNNLMPFKQDWAMKTEVQAYHPQFGYGSTGKQDGISYSYGMSLKNIDIVLNQSVTIHGSIINTKGKPVSNAEITSYNTVPKQNIPVNSAGCFEILHAPPENCVLWASAPGYVTEKIVKSYPPNTGQDLTITLKKEGEEDPAEISGYVFDRNMNPMNDIPVQCILMETERSRRGWKRTRTDNKGYFHLDGLEKDKAYVVVAKTENKPNYEKKLYQIIPSQKDIIILLDFATVSLEVELDCSKVDPSKIENRDGVITLLKLNDEGFTKKGFSSISYHNGNCTTGDLSLTSIGTYLVSVEFSFKTGKFSGSTVIQITEETPSQYTITLVLTGDDLNNKYYVAATCLDSKGNTVKDGYSVLCRYLDPSPVPIVLQQHVAEEPNPFAGMVLFLLDRSGTYEFVYTTDSHQTFMKKIFQLSKSECTPWNPSGFENPIPALSLPSVLFPDKKN